jgi:hypothetical protein
MIQGVTFQTNVRIVCVVTCTQGFIPCTNLFVFNINITVQHADVMSSISRDIINTKYFKQYATSTIIQFNSIYLPNYSTAKRSITELVRAHTKQTHTHKQKTKQGDMYYLHNNHSIVPTMPTMLQWKCRCIYIHTHQSQELLIFL